MRIRIWALGVPAGARGVSYRVVEEKVTGAFLESTLPRERLELSKL